MSPNQLQEIVAELKGLGDRIGYLERVVYGAVGAVAVTAFFITTGIIEIGAK